MKENIINYFRSKSSTFQTLLCAILVASIFSIRWRYCLPFSGYMPVINNPDRLDIWGRYILWAKEPFGFPIGLIKTLSFPFQTADISHGPIVLFAILFKLFSRIYAPFSEFYYFVLFELLCVFFAAYFTCLLLNSFKVTSFWLRLLGTVLVSLSFPLLHRSSIYYGLSFEVAYVPVYLAYGYFFIRIYKHPNWISFFLLTSIFPIAALIDQYLLFGISFMFFICLCFYFFEFIMNRNKFNLHRIRFITTVFVLGIFLSQIVLFSIQIPRNLKLPSHISPLTGRCDKGWGYGGGLGGGFHVADVLTVVIPTGDDESVPSWKRCGPSSYLAKLGFPITTDDLQDGQYEGFAYLGTTTIGILSLLIIMNALSLIRNFRTYSVKLRLKMISKLLLVNEFFSLPMIIGVSTFMLYILSWGYIIHIGGIRLNNIVTPSLIMAVVVPKFMFARALGRLAIPFMLFIGLVVIVCINRYLWRYMYQGDKFRKVLIASIMIFLVTVHISEIWGYLEPSKATYGNDIADVFGKDDKASIKGLLQDKRALMVVPSLRDNVSWGKICFSLAFHSNIPISGSFAGLDAPEHLRQYNLDINCILKGNVKDIINRYGEVAIAAPSGIAEKILSKSNIPLECHRLRDQDVAILVLDK